MSPREFFEKYVFGFMIADIEREIALARSNVLVEGKTRSFEGGGNFLCALGLLCYTEATGAFVTGKTGPRTSRKNFNAFFESLGPTYKVFGSEVDVYDVFRCGMVHEYFVKENFVIFMLAGNVHETMSIDGETATLKPAPSMLKGNVPYGIGKLDDGRYFFVVEQYLEDFRDACQSLLEEIEADPSHPYYKIIAERPDL